MTDGPLRLFTSESVTGGHPDKICDQISDAILDDLLRQDPGARVAVETMASASAVHVAGEVRTTGSSDVEAIVRNVIADIGFTTPTWGFDAHSCTVENLIHEQSSDIAQGVDESFSARQGHSSDAYDRLGAGDQGMMVGYACRETPALMPAPISAAHLLTERLTTVRRDGTVEGLGPDGKAQVTMGYDDRGAPRTVHTIVISTQHSENIDPGAQLSDALTHHVVQPVLSELEQWGLDTTNTLTHINPAGRFVIGGPRADVGLTGRKIIVDTYGGMARHGGGAFSGKDATKVDRTGAYAMRWIAKTVVAAGIAERCEAQVAYAIGMADPVSLFVETFGTGTVPDAQIAAAVSRVFDLRPAALIDQLELRRPIFAKTAVHGHFGRPHPEFTWESTERSAQLQAAL